MTPALRQNLTLAVGTDWDQYAAAAYLHWSFAAGHPRSQRHELYGRTPDRAAGDRDGGAGAGRWLGRSLYRSKAQYCAEPADYRGRRPAAEIAPNSGLLLTSALAGGIGIGIIQAAIPAVIKHLFPRRTSLVMGLWSAALMGGGGLGAAFTPWLASHSAARHDALARWALPALWLCSAGWRFVGNCLAHRIRPALPGSRLLASAAPDAGTLFRTDQCRLRQPDRPAASLLHPARR